MKLTPNGESFLKHIGALRYDDYVIRRHNETTWAVEHCYARNNPLALHEGTSVEAARLFKLLLITRRLAQ